MHDLDNPLHPLAEADAAPLGITLCRSPLVIRRHVLGPVARQGADKPVLAGEVIAAIMQVHAVAVARQGDIAAVGVHARRRQDMGAVHRHALRLVDGRGIAVVDAVVVLEVERDAAPVVGAHGHGSFADLNDGPERAVLHAKAALVLQEHDAISAGEATLAAFHRQAHVIAQIAGFPHPLAGGLVERAHLVIGVGEDDAAVVGRRLPVAVPAVDQIVARLLACRGGMDHAVRRHRHGSHRRSGRSPDRASRHAASPPAGGAPRRSPPRRGARGSSGTPRPLRWIATAADRRPAPPWRQPRRHGTARAPTGACRPCPPRR